MIEVTPAPQETENAQIIRLLTQIRDLQASRAGIYFDPRGEWHYYPPAPRIARGEVATGNKSQPGLGGWY